MMSLPVSRAEAAHELLRRRAIRGSLTEWCRACGFEPAAHHRLIIEKLEAVDRGEIDRLAIFMPPGSAKSTYASILFPPWHMARHPGRSVIAASHTKELAERFGRRVRNLIAENGSALGVAVADDNKAAGRWETTAGGEYYAAGVGGAITGRRADLAIIDDPIRSREDADSESIRGKQWDWFKFDLSTRLKPGAAAIIIQTRWHEEDLSGRILEAEPDRWEIVRLPMEAERGDPLGRAIGAPLWPEWFTDEMRDDAKRDARLWSALYQQRPIADDGFVFKPDSIKVIDELPDVRRWVRAWDLAATDGAGDYTAGCLMGVAADGRIVVRDVTRLQGGPEKVEAMLVSTANADGRGTRISIPQDPGQAGKAHAAYLTRALAGYSVSSSPETGDKVTRAGPFASQVNVGNVALMRGEWNAAFVSELRNFPVGKYDDQVDAASRAFNVLSDRRGPPTVSDSMIRMARGGR